MAPRGTRKLTRLVRTAALDAASVAGHAAARRGAAPGVAPSSRPPTISFEASCFQRPPSGVARYVRALADDLPALLPEHRVVLRGTRPPSLRQVARESRTLGAENVVLHHVPWQDFAGHHNWPLRWAPRSVLTVHDVINGVHPDYHPAWERWWYRRTLRLACRWADRVIVPSHATSAALVRLASAPLEHLRVIPHGVDPDLGAAVPREADAATRGRLGIPGEYLLCVSTLYAHKGLDTLLDGYARLRTLRAATRGGTPALVIVGEPLWPPTVAAIRARITEPELAGHVLLTGHVGDRELISLYRGARALLYPSAHEGFGLPVLEAMALGTPVVCSDSTSLPEVAGDAAAFFTAGDSASLSAAIERLLTDPALAGWLVARGRARARALSWRACARATADLHRELLESRRAEAA